MCDPQNIRLIGMVAAAVAVLIIVGVMLFSESWAKARAYSPETPFGAGLVIALPIVALVVVVSVGMEVFCG